jgi:SAM-dependent methyltransferase
MYGNAKGSTASQVPQNLSLCVACHHETRYFCKFPGELDPTRTMGVDEHIHYAQCSSCGTIQQTPLPSEEYLSSRVATEYSSAENRFLFEKQTSDNAELQHRAIAKTLTNYGISCNVLEVGTGIGNLCSILIENGITCRGIDLSPELVAAAQKRGLPVEQGNIRQLGSNESFSAIVMSHVFEHLCDPEDTLKCIYQLLEVNGLFLSAQPTAAMTNILSRLLRVNNPQLVSPFSLAYLNLNPWHIVIYSIAGMKQITNRLGFDLLEIIPLPSVRNQGLLGVIRSCYSFFNKVGERAFHDRWPFHVAHLFVLRKL